MIAFLCEYQTLIAFALACSLAMGMALRVAWLAGHETAYREFAARALTKTRHQTSERI